MADVFGTIGNQPVELNNAATEATLRQLLQAVIATGTKNTTALSALAQSSGLNPATVQQANQAVQQTTPQMNALGKAAFFAGATFGQVEQTLKTVWSTGEQLASGNVEASTVLRNFATMLPPVLSHVVRGLSALAAFQEGMLGQYQTLTKAGVNFGGSLTDLRLAASQTYMTMQEFGTLMKANSDVLSRMGGTVDQGARAFVTASQTLNKSELGSDLRALGYTTAEVNQGMLDYISITGGRTKKEMQNTEQIKNSTAAYLQELDALAQITGKTKEEQEKALKEAAQNAAWKAYLATLDPKEYEKAIQGLNEALSKGGKGAGQAFMAAAQGLPPMTKEAQQYTALARNMNNVTLQQAAMIKDNTKTLGDMKQAGNAYSAAAVQDKKTIEKAGSAVINASGEQAGIMSDIFTASTQAIKQGTDTVEGANKQRAEVEKNQKERMESQAKAAVESKKALEEMGQAILAAVLPVVKMLLPIVNLLAPLAPAIMAVIAALATLKAGFIAHALLMKAQAATAAAGGGLGGALSAGVGALRGGGAAAPAGPAAALPAGAGAMAGVGPALSGAAAGLRAFANPMVIAGAAGFGVAIAAIGAGIAGATWLIGKALPTLAEGFMKFTEIDGAKLGANAFGIGKLGIGLLPFAPMALWGIPVGLALNSMGSGLQKIASVDPSKLAAVAAGMEKVKAATPTVGESLRAGIAGLVSKVVGPSETTATPTKDGKAESGSELIKLISEVQRLNTVNLEMLKFSKEIAEHAKRNVDATKALNGDLFKF